MLDVAAIPVVLRVKVLLKVGGFDCHAFGWPGRSACQSLTRRVCASLGWYLGSFRLDYPLRASVVILLLLRISNGHRRTGRTAKARRAKFGAAEQKAEKTDLHGEGERGTGRCALEEHGRHGIS